MLSTLLNPDLLVICGGVAQAMKPVLPSITERLDALTYTPPRIACSTLGESVVATGAIRLALNQVQDRAMNGAPALRDGGSADRPTMEAP